MNNYNDIINLPHHQSLTRRRMTIQDRAAQFAPFAALKGYEEAVAESATESYLLVVSNENAMTDNADLVRQLTA